jgi:NADH:ubiquinone oxidoreductase subunit E
MHREKIRDILVEKLERPKQQWKDNTEIYLQEIVCGGSCEHSNEPLGSIKGGIS